ncbi:T9SS type A sorting domain-containing protein [Lewinella sp. 4G2]|uniref:T9SS type A sorting domain-containing protein n=1 Tax=Lewinella sp. 4G2 TaxID=1803372 RepID=UPI0007B48A9E|nr:T9SS type A sorting domain-containing protein [Lewinella sp. 4G2]OAV43228.1 hypothetical protein A3850_001380 [Lewinella sp. 4G2]
MNQYLLKGMSAVALVLFLFTGAFAQVVTSTADSGPGSLRDVVAAALPGGVITFDASTDGTPITLTSGEIVIDKLLTISGNGVDNTMISGGNSSRIFNITPPLAITVIMNDLMLTEGNADMGGAIMVAALTSATLTDVSITNSEATGADASMGGGAIAVMGGIVTVASSTFSGNSASGASGSGGAIIVGDGGTLTVDGSTFSGNSASRAGGAIEDVSGDATVTNITDTNMSGNSTGSAPGNGGAVHVTGAGDLNYTGGRVIDNVAASEGGGLWIGTGTMTVTNVLLLRNVASGDEATNGGGALFSAGGTLNVSNSRILANSANGSAGSGGGIFNDAGTLTVENTLIRNNSAVRAGGGIEETEGGTATLTNVRLTANNAGSSPGNGGGMHITGAGDVVVNGGAVVQNTASNEGGGLWNGAGTMDINDVYFRRNVASGDDADTGGGGVFNLAGTVNINAGTVFRQNVADGASGSGGGLLNDVGGTVNITGAEFALNTANRAGGAIEDVSGAETMVTITDTKFLSNFAGDAPGNGGAIHITGPGEMSITGGVANQNVASQEGGGFWNGSGTMTVTDVTFSSNEALGTAADDGGGALFNNGGTLVVNGGVFDRNVATEGSGSGGAIHNAIGGTLTVTGGRYTRNEAARAGGAIEDASDVGTMMTITDATMSQNMTGPMPGNGGAIHITASGDAEITGGLYNDNVATSEGGALWNGGGTMTVSGVAINGNRAEGDMADQGGGGIFNEGGILMVMNKTQIIFNEATGASGSGGGILNNTGGQLTVNRSQLKNNSASRAGGGIEDNSAEEGTVSMVFANLIGNTTGSAPGNGGGLHVTGPGTVDIDGGLILNNTAASEGGGLWNGTGTMTVSRAKIVNNIAMGDDATNGGGGIFNLDGGTLMVSTSTRFSGNQATGASGSGGAIFNSEGSSLTVDRSFFNNNSASRAGGAIEDNSQSGTTVIISSSNFDGNTTGSAPGNGGAIHITGDGDMEISRSNFTNNTAALEGGALWNGAGLMTVTQTDVLDNEAQGPALDDGGGGVFNNGGALVLERSTVSNNSATGSGASGGGVLSIGGSIQVMVSTITGNEAPIGGGVHAIGENVFSSSTIAANNATMSGGGIIVTGESSATLYSNIVAANTSAGIADLEGDVGSFFSDGFNLIGQDDMGVLAAIDTDTSGVSGAPIDPMVGPLAQNGGPTQTHNLLCGSPAIDAGNPSDTDLDQGGRGVFGGIRDIGAFERRSTCSAPDVTALQSSPVAKSFEAATTDRVSVYPNPVSAEAVNVAIPTEYGTDVRLDLLDLTGRLISSLQATAGNVALPLANQQPGTYLVRITAGELTETQKLIIR